MSFTAENTAVAEEIIARYPVRRSALIPLLHLAQEQNGHLTEEAMEHVAELVGVTPAQVVDILAQREEDLAFEYEGERFAAKGEWPAGDNPLVNAPHTAAEALAADWTHPYTRLEAAFPDGDPDSAAKYWPPVGRVANVYSDRHLVCSCPPVDAYREAAD